MRKFLIAALSASFACNASPGTVEKEDSGNLLTPSPPPNEADASGSEFEPDASADDSGTSNNSPKGPIPSGGKCTKDSDCNEGACNYAGKCVEAPSCAIHLGGDTCGFGEVNQNGAKHESCCKSLPVSGYIDPLHPGKIVYLDKYEITAGRIRAFVEKISLQNGGSPNVKHWIEKNRPLIWDDSWNQFLPSDFEGGTVIINRRLLGDPRVEDGVISFGPGMILPPPTDEPRRMGINFQFGSEIYVDLHGNNCGTYEGSYGFPTFWYSPDILSRDGQSTRPDGLGYLGETIQAKDVLDVKSMNCITNAMLAAFCAWDGGQLATDEVLDYVTETPETLGNISGCGTQYDNHGELLGNVFSNTVRVGGRCADAFFVNATFDAGDSLPVPGSILNTHNYHYPDTGEQSYDKSWQVSAPGRANLFKGEQVDTVRINPGDEPWMDLHGNLNESALDMSGSSFTGKFSLKFRGIGYGSSRSNLNVTPILGENILRIQRPEAKAAYTGGRCMRFK